MKPYTKYNLHDLVYVYDENELKQVKIISVEYAKFRSDKDGEIKERITYGIQFFENSTVYKYYQECYVYDCLSDFKNNVKVGKLYGF
jgi:hypothetical protein|nr:MAG TPA: hypothetical protein [Caudoviricetes sp.]